MILMMFGLGLKVYFKSGFNIFDCIVVNFSILDIVITLMVDDKNSTSGVSVFRAFRLLRIFKILKSWKNLRILLKTVISSLPAVSNIFFLTVLYIFIFSLMAKQFFGDEECTADSRYCFDTTLNALQTIFIVLTGENWNEIMSGAIL